MNYFNIVIVCLVFLLIFLKFFSMWIKSAKNSNVCLVNKTAIVTGGSSGIGYQTALLLAARGCKVIIADINVNENIAKKMIEETNNPNITLEFLNLASFASIRDFAKRLLKSEEKLDILINNAGIGRSLLTKTEDDLSMVWQVNYYGSFLLTHLLLDLLKKSGSARILFTSSPLAHFNNIVLSDIGPDGIRKKSVGYANSKFLQIVASAVFAEKLKDYNITCNAWSPYIVNTPIFQESQKASTTMIDNLGVHILKFLGFFIGVSPEQGARTPVYLAVAKEVRDITGVYFGLKPWNIHNTKLCQAIWKASEVSVGLRPEEKL